jgi:hypothetical protein
MCRGPVQAERENVGALASSTLVIWPADGGSSSPLLDVNVRRRSRNLLASPSGAADPPYAHSMVSNFYDKGSGTGISLGMTLD